MKLNIEEKNELKKVINLLKGSVDGIEEQVGIIKGEIDVLEELIE